uniref:Mitochondrial carrier protein n=1 Tax=Chromera velia CCMP2878 TaxID=1169474 RepID=A0A0G4FHF6_9ALVE|eukprot:Cvel_17026.t1-p1 / transcript=Cvel_17026.t1 / gene=Cvel_17026 / organism=Chromera_velia_CCMP2878 / gene_product=Uncharacterized membrane protein C365.16, putative / transcript_product=Uncharacterized membrane protein C365.16, putative / location=Cvel_scaffold1339:20980-22743(+) / protein_length=281 / sequence_SO=supercontig / SO=protein_coding / is_pseudo=false
MPIPSASAVEVSPSGADRAESSKASAPAPVSKVVQRMGGDAAAACGAAAGVAPFITVIDRSIIKAANGSQPLFEGIVTGFKQMVLAPHRFVLGRDFRLIFGLYAATYLSANWAITLCEWKRVSDEIPKFVSSSVTNLLLCVRKDAIFATIFGTRVSAFPPASYALFFLRDAMTMAASFNAPPHISNFIKKTNPEIGKSTADNIAQMACPVGIQTISTPIHLVALDLFNRPAATAAQRVGFIGSTYFSMVSARMARIAPAFGIGGILNRQIRTHFVDSIGDL